jgi:hypothetical protein
MKWLDSFIQRCYNRARERDECTPIGIDYDRSMKVSGRLSSSRSVEANNGFRINVYKASGGTVIETTMYDRVKDREHRGLFVVTDDKDLGQELGKIITMENLRA